MTWIAFKDAGLDKVTKNMSPGGTFVYRHHGAATASTKWAAIEGTLVTPASI